MLLPPHCPYFLGALPQHTATARRNSGGRGGGCGCQLMANFMVLNLTLIFFFFFFGNVEFAWASKTSCRVDDFADAKLEIVDFLSFFSLGWWGGVEAQMSA